MAEGEGFQAHPVRVTGGMRVKDSCIYNQFMIELHRDLGDVRDGDVLIITITLYIFITSLLLKGVNHCQENAQLK